MSTNTHFAVVYFSGDPEGKHPDEGLRGGSPSLHLIAAGPEDRCWRELATWLSSHRLRQWEKAEVVAREL